MKIAWLTDVHLELVNQKSRKVLFEEIAEARPDLILLGGDICNSEFLEAWLLKLYQKIQVPIYFVLGNHDFYKSSICEVRGLARSITKTHEQISWLPEVGVVPLTDDVGLIGHGCWGDARVGSFFNSPLSLNDFKYIQELSSLSKHGQLEQIKRLGSEAAEYLESAAAMAAKNYGKVVVLTHVPPFPKACFYLGRPSKEGLPFFCSKAAGDSLIKVAANNPQTHFLVLSGHTHDAVEVKITDNLKIIVAEAEYGRPDFKMLDLSNIFSKWQGDEQLSPK
ncbi:metallophosphoesterase family protein [Geopsychrobacter electrodiphilus]|uniref:metallophosphoesterase family protein n=1 Tax=Geopsychrobacter electrodiphilus TaxID=225196 RepID=UPI00037FBF08|nr:metallophosphoesterase [Geopsychrobacter electrodiphilus]